MILAKLLVVLAGLMGAGGVALSAAGAHAAPGANLGVAGSMLLFHAAAVIALLGARAGGVMHAEFALWAGLGLVLGSAVFAGDLTLRAFAGARLFPMAAPTGGVVLMLSWLVVAFSGALGGK